MTNAEPNIQIPVDLTNPGQFFACCGLLELADRLWPGAEGWFESDRFCIDASSNGALDEIVTVLENSTVVNTMTIEQCARLEYLSAMTKKQRAAEPGFDDEKKVLESLRRELPILLVGDILFRIDWFCDEFSGGSRFKTWAGQQSVLNIATAMHKGMRATGLDSESALCKPARGTGLPFNFDSDLGGQGSALDIGFSFDPLAGSSTTRIEGTCKPAIELLAFIGLQRFRPHELKGQNRFVYSAWRTPLPPSVAACLVCQAVDMSEPHCYEFRLLYRTKYLKSFLPAIPFQGERDE